MGDYGVGTRHSGLSVIETDDGNFNYNEKVAVEVSQKSGQPIWQRPLGGVVNQDGPFIFVVDAMTDRYLQFSRAGLLVTASVVNKDGTDIHSWKDVVAPINLLGMVMWDKVEVLLNGQSMPGATTTNKGMQAYIETALSYDTDAARSHLQSCFYHPDTAFEFGNMAVNSEQLRLAYARALERGEEPFPEFDEADVADPNVPPPYEGYTDAEVLSLPINAQDDDGGRPPPVRRTQPRPEGADPDMPDAVAPEDEVVYQREVRERTKRLRRRLAVRDAFQATFDAVRHLLRSSESRTNRGYNSRFETSSGSHRFQMYSPLISDLARLNNEIGPGNRLEIRLTMYPHAFLLNSFLGYNEYRLRIHDMQLHMHAVERRERIVPPVRELYLMTSTETHKQIVAAGSPRTTFRLHNGGVMPKTVVITQALQKAVDGQYDYNPFNFHHFDIQSLTLIINGERHPSSGLQFDFSGHNALVARAYKWMFENTGIFEGERGNLVSWELFQGGQFIVPFDLTPDKCNGLHHHNAQYGYIDVEITWRHPLPDPIYVIYEKVAPKVLINDKLTGQVICVDPEA